MQFSFESQYQADHQASFDEKKRRTPKKKRGTPKVFRTDTDDENHCITTLYMRPKPTLGRYLYVIPLLPNINFADGITLSTPLF